ncbi:MAG: YihY/virulence factor BrkB family protein [Burkholderiales bacterium]
MTPRQALTLAHAAVTAWIDDRAASMGAALAYYTLFSLAPLLLIVISVAGLIFGRDAVRGEIFAQLQGLIGPPGAAAVQELLQSVNHPAGGIVGTLVGLLLMLVGATSVFAELQNTLDHIWRAPRENGPTPGFIGLWRLLRARVLSFGLILGIGFLLIVSLLLSAAVAGLQRWWSPLFGGWEGVITAVNLGSSFALTTTMFAMIYKIMPRVRIHWSDVWVGAIVTAALFTVGRWGIGLYLGMGTVASGFGAAGSLVVVLVWVYYSAQIFLLGAEFTWVYAHTLGSRRNKPQALPVMAPRPTP